MPTPVHGTIQFFAPTGEIDLTASHWTFQNGGAVNSTSARASDLGRDGNELYATLHNKRSTTSFTYVHDGATGNYAFPKVGTVSGAWHVDSFKVSWNRERARATLTVNCHRHDQGVNHTTAPRKYSATLTQIPVPAFGVPAVFTGGTGKNAFTLDANAVIDLREAEYSVSCTHIDEPGRTGANLASNNHDGVETLEVSFTGAATADDYSTDWSAPSSSSTPSNTGVTTSSLSLEHHIAHDAS